MTQAFAYLDDIIVHAPNVELHLEYLEKVLQVHLQAGLRLQPHKTNLLRDEAVYLGHVINSDGVRPDPAKLDAVQDWPQPTNITELQSYLGLCNYYRDFVPTYSEVALPLLKFLEGSPPKKQPIQFGPDAIEAFVALKKALCQAPILAFPNFQDDAAPFILDSK